MLVGDVESELPIIKSFISGALLFIYGLHVPRVDLMMVTADLVLTCFAGMKCLCKLM